MKCFNNNTVYPISMYTDGACSGNPGPGGWSFLLEKDNKIINQRAGFVEDTTNNAMELRAIAEGLEHIDKPVTIYTDSNYAYLGITDWLWRWEQNGWKTTSGSSVKNQLLWKRILKHLCDQPISVRKVKAHSGDKYNEFVDSAAQTMTRYSKQMKTQLKNCRKCKKHLPESKTEHCSQYHTLYPEYIPCKFFELDS